MDGGAGPVRDRAATGRIGVSSSGGQPRWLLAALVAVVLLPLLLTPHPPLQDWANHIARLHVLSNPDDPVLSQFYRPDWALRPNLAFDLPAVVLARFMPAEAAGKIFLLFAMAVFATAPMALEKALRGEIRGASLLALPFVFNLALQKGFLGFYLAAGLSVWAYALWIAASGPWRRAAVAHVSAAILFICHLYALGVFGLLIGGHWLGERLAGRTSGRSWLVAGLLSGSAFLIPAWLFLSSPTAEAAAITRYVSLDLKLRGLVSALQLLPTPVSLAVTALALLPFGLRLMRRQTLFDPAVRVPLIVLCILPLVLPFWLMSSANADWRLVPPLVLVIAGAADLSLATKAARRTIALYAGGLAVVASVSAGLFWHAAQPMIASIERVMAPLQPGARLFPAILDPLPWNEDLLVFQHEPSRAVLQQVFVPSVFAYPSQQPLRFTEEVEPLREPLGAVYFGEVHPDWDAVAANFDCLLLMHTDPASMGTTPDLPLDATPVESEVGFVLYRIGSATVCGGA